MLKIRALNREYSSDEDAPGIRKEAQEEIALDMYNKALRLQCNNNYDESKHILYQLLNENIPLLESQGGLPKTMSTIKYSCYINIGAIAMKQCNEKEALDNFVIAAELDKTDVTLWYKIGMLALKLDKFRQSAYAFIQGLHCSESHWPCLDNLISVLFAIQDTVACLQYIGKALMLDTYYVKGVVLRKQIYQDNPWTEDYYKQFNPDHIYEPKIEYEPTEEEELRFLGEVRKLCDRINTAEKLLEAKPLATIPLPRGLEDFTWVELGKTVTEVHQYLTDNNMSHLTNIDVKRCMSTGGATVPIPVEDKIEDVVPSPKEATNLVLGPGGIEIEENDVEMQLEPEKTTEEKALSIERLPSNSENDDNEEIEQENEDPEPDDSSTATQKQDRSLNKSASKRKRDLVSELQIWGWHSKRKATKRSKSEKDYRIEDALVRIIPPHLIPNGLPDDKEVLFEDSRSPIDPTTESLIRKAHTYFGSEDEAKDVKQFWSRNWTNCDSIDLIQAYVYSVAELWNKKWPYELVALYVTAYEMLRLHTSHPALFSDDVDWQEMRRDALSTLLYAELITHTNNKKYLEDVLHCSSESHLTIVSGWENRWLEEYNDISIRTNWLRAHLFRKKNDNTQAIMALQLIQDVVNFGNLPTDTFKLTIPNNEKHQLVNMALIEAMLAKLELIDSLSRVEELFNKNSYPEVAEIIKLTFNSSNNKVTYGKIGRQAQLGILLHSLWYTNQAECFVWCEKCLHETLKHILKPATDNDKWEMVLEKCLLMMVEIIKSETVGVIDILDDECRCRLIESLATLCRKQINTDTSNRIPMPNILPYPWILLHYILLRDEHRQQAKKVVNHVSREERTDTSRLDDEEELPPSIAMLFSAHEFLGPKGWCLTKLGVLLHFMLDSIIHRLDAPILELHRDKIDIHLEQAFFCLYQHPCKKNKVSRHLADHNVNPLPLTWERAQQLYEYFCPEALPEFDSYKSISITSDLEQLLQRITAIIPKECDPQPMLPKINDYIHANATSLPEAIDFPARIKAIYYLLGDYYFKQSEVKRSYKYFLLDLCINPSRIDTWAGLSLGIHSQLEYKLNHCERFKNEMEFIEKAKSAKTCFKEALKLNNSHVTLWIEFGSFEYMVHAFCSRVLKYESEMLSMEKFEALEAEKESYLESSRNGFLRALELYQVDQGDADERWLFHYMIAKISEKKQEDPKIYMQHYTQAAALLHENKCQYPEKINYNNPQHLSLEALEVHYRINASILKYLEAHDSKPVPIVLGKLFKKSLDSSVIQKSKYETKNTKNETRVGAKVQTQEDITDEVKKCLDNLLNKIERMEKETEKGSDSDDVVVIESDKEANDVDPILPEDVPKSADEKSEKSEKDPRSEDETNIRKSTTTATTDSSTSSSSSSSSSSSDSESDDTSSTSSTDSTNENMSDNEIVNLVDRCIVGLEHCIRRLPQNYKALYRLAHVYYSYSKKKDLNKCKQLLLGEYKCKNSVLVTGLFSDRKTSNFFNGIWRIPSSEIDRPGSLSAHMSRCVTLLLQILRDTHDHRTLLELCLQLRRIPDPDKVYIRNSEREQLSEDALTMCIQSLRRQLKEIETMSPLEAEKLMIDLFKAYQRSQKNLPLQEKIFAGMLTEAYRKLTEKGNVPESVNVLDVAVKYCQQTRIAEKVKKQQVPPPLPAQKPIVSAPAPLAPPIVQPTPANMNPLALPTLRRPSLGRPRGRPPGPAKQPNQTRSPRGRSPLNPYSWSNPLFTNTMTTTSAQNNFDYLKHYQEELMRQYNQTQTMSQLSSLASLFGTSGLGLTSASLLNPNATATSASNSLMNSTYLQSLQQLNSLSSMPAAQFSQLLGQINPQLMAGLSADKLFQMSANAMGQASKAGTSSTKTGPSGSKTKQKLPTKLATAATMSTGSFKYPNLANMATVTSADGKPKAKNKNLYNPQHHQQLKKDIPQAHSSMVPMDKSKSLMKDRPGISITPIAPPTLTKMPALSPVAVTTMPSSSSPGKTLQEKLADKQKQQKNVAKSLDFQAAAQAAVTAPTMPYPVFPSPADFKKYQNVIPNYLLESGLSISQVQQKMSKTSQLSKTKPQKPKHSATSSLPISMSVVKKLPPPPSAPGPEKKSKPSASDDDVIIIE